MGGALAGCSTLLAVRGQQERADRNAVISGIVEAWGHDVHGPLVVGLATRDGSGFALVDYFVAEKPGPFLFAVEPGTYWIGASRTPIGTPATTTSPPCAPIPILPCSSRRASRCARRLAFPSRDGRLPRGPFSLADVQVKRSPGEQKHVSAFGLSVAGAVDARRPALRHGGRAKRHVEVLRLPAQGTPRHLLPGALRPEEDPGAVRARHRRDAAGIRDPLAALDRTRFQPWVLYYPSGARLDTSSPWSTQLFMRLRTTRRRRTPRWSPTAWAASSRAASSCGTTRPARRDRSHVRHDLVAARRHGVGGEGRRGLAGRASLVVRPRARQRLPRRVLLRGSGDRTKRRRLPEQSPTTCCSDSRAAPGGLQRRRRGRPSQLRPEAQEEARSVRGYDETTRASSEPRRGGASERVLAGPR